MAPKSHAGRCRQDTIRGGRVARGSRMPKTGVSSRPSRRDRGHARTNKTTGSTRVTQPGPWAPTVSPHGAAVRRITRTSPTSSGTAGNGSSRTGSTTSRRSRRSWRLTDSEREGLGAPDKFRVDITPYFISLIDPDRPGRPHPAPGHAAGRGTGSVHGHDGGLAAPRISTRRFRAWSTAIPTAC